MDVIFHPIADDEYWDQVYYYDKISHKLSLKFCKSFSELIEGISKNPYLCHNRGGGICSVRVHGYPFSVFYKVDGNKIFVLSVCHERRNPSVWKSRK